MRVTGGCTLNCCGSSLSSVEGTAKATERSALRKALRLSTWDDIFANLYANLTRDVFLVGYALALRASEVQVGLLAAFPLVANVAQIFSTYLTELTGRRPDQERRHGSRRVK